MLRPATKYQYLVTLIPKYAQHWEMQSRALPSVECHFKKQCLLYSQTSPHSMNWKLHSLYNLQGISLIDEDSATSFYIKCQ